MRDSLEMLKLSGSLAVVLALRLAWDFAYADPPSMNEPQAVARPDQSHWSEITFLDLAKQMRADCTSDTPQLLRCTGPIQIVGLTKTSILGKGIRVRFLDSHAGKGGISLVNVSDVRIANLEIGWQSGGVRDPLIPGVQRLQSFGTVKPCGSQEIGGALILDVPLDGSIPVDTISVWDDSLGWPWYPSSPDVFEVNLTNDSQITFSGGRSGCIPQLAKLVSRRVLVRHLYTTHAFACENCKDVIVEKLRVTSAPGMGFVFERGSSNIILRDNVIAPRCAPHCQSPEPSIFADGAHFAGGKGNILIEGNDFGWNGDDSVNITGLLLPARVGPVPGRDGLWLTVDNKWWSGRSWQLTLGSRITIFDRSFLQLGQANIVAIEPTMHQLQVSPLPPNATDILIVCSDDVPKNVIIRNNHFHDHRARGILIGASDSLIENNAIERVTMAAILVPADDGQNYEGPGAENVIIRNNHFAAVNRHPNLPDYPSAISAGVISDPLHKGQLGNPIQHIVVQRNTFSDVYTNANLPISFGKGVLDGRANDN